MGPHVTQDGLGRGQPSYQTINDKRWRIFTCDQKLAYSQLNLSHGTKQKTLMKKLKIKTEMLRRNGPVIKPWSQS